MVAGNFSSQFAFFKLRNNYIWFEDLPVISMELKKSALNLSGAYTLYFPNPSGVALNLFSYFQTQELWIAYTPGNKMYRAMAGQINNISPDKNFLLRVDGRGMSGKLTDNKINDSWTNMRGDFILCDPTYGVIPLNHTDVTTWNGFTDDYDKFDYWNTTRWGVQPAWAEIYDGEVELQGDAGETRTLTGQTEYNFEVIEFKLKTSAASDKILIGFESSAGTSYVRFSLEGAVVNCENSDAVSSQSSPTVDTITQTDYNYYRIEWAPGEARFFVNGVLQITETSNVPTALMAPFIELETTDALVTLDYVKVIFLTSKQDTYVAKEQFESDLIEEICDAGNSTSSVTQYIDDDSDFNAKITKAISSGYSFGLNSSVYTNAYQKAASIALNNEAKDLYNVIRIRGGETLTEVSAPTWVDQFIGDGVETTFTLGYKAKKPLTSVELDGTPVTEDTDFTVTYGVEHTIIKFATAPGDTLTINARYDYYTPVIATAQNDASIAQYGVKRVYSKTDDTITSNARARNLAGALLAYYKDPRTVIKVVIPMDPRQRIGTTVNIDSPYHGISDTEYEIIEFSHTMGLGRWQTELTLANADITTSAEIIREILQQLKSLQTRGDTTKITLDDVPIPEYLASTETIEEATRYISDSFIASSTLDNAKAGRGQILDKFETGVASWSGTNCAVSSDTSVSQVGSKNMKLVASASPFSTESSQSLGDLSAYTEVASGAPSSGTVGIWVYCTVGTEITSATLRIGSGSSDYSEVASVAPFDDAFTLYPGWNYLVFRLVGSATTGTPDWTSVAYARVEFESASTPTLYCDYFTIGSGDSIALNGAGYRYVLIDYATLAVTE